MHFRVTAGGLMNLPQRHTIGQHRFNGHLLAYADYDCLPIVGNEPCGEFWFWVLFAVRIGVVAGIIDLIVGFSIVSWVVCLGLLLPGIAVTIRHLHDTSRSG